MGEGLTINEAAETTGWSPRMLRYVERVGLLAPPRSAGGYRIFRAEELQRLRTLRELLSRHEVGLAEVAFAKRLRSEDSLRDAVDEWLTTRPSRPEGVPATGWLRFESDWHQKQWPALENDAANNFEPFLATAAAD